MRECFSCGSIKTYIDPKRRNAHWYGNGITNQWLCESCNNKYIKHPKWNPITNPTANKKWNPINNPIYSPRDIFFKDISIRLDHNPRTGYCSNCTNNVYDGSCKRTHMHHIKYHEEDPLKDTIELCNPCHRKIHRDA